MSQLQIVLNFIFKATVLCYRLKYSTVKYHDHKMKSPPSPRFYGLKYSEPKYYDHKMNSPPSPRFFCTPTNIQEGAEASTISDLLSVQDVNSKLGLMRMITLFFVFLYNQPYLSLPRGKLDLDGYRVFIIFVNQSMQFCS